MNTWKQTHAQAILPFRCKGGKDKFAFAASSTFTRITTVLWECAIGSWRARCATFQCFTAPLWYFITAFSPASNVYAVHFRTTDRDTGWCHRCLQECYPGMSVKFYTRSYCSWKCRCAALHLNQWRKEKKCTYKCIPAASACKSTSPTANCKCVHINNGQISNAISLQSTRQGENTSQKFIQYFFCFRSTSITSHDQAL